MLFSGRNTLFYFHCLNVVISNKKIKMCLLVLDAVFPKDHILQIIYMTERAHVSV